MYLYPTNNEEVVKTVIKLKDGKSLEYDVLRAEVLKRIGEVTTNLLTHLVNNCFKISILSHCLKYEIIKSLHKGEDKLEVINISKIIEKILKKRINNLMEKYKI